MGAEKNLSTPASQGATGGMGPAHGPGGRARMYTERPKDFSGTMRRLLSYVRDFRAPIIAAVALAIVSVAFSVLGPKILGDAVTMIFEGLVEKVQGTGGIDYARVASTLLILLALYGFSSLAMACQGWLMAGVTQRLGYKLRRQISEKVAVVPMSYFEDHSKGDVLSRITNDVDTLTQSLNQSVTQLITSVVQVLGVIVIMVVISPALTGVTLLTLPLSVAIVGVVVHFSQRFFREQQAVLGEVNGTIEEDFAGQSIISVFNRGSRATEEFDDCNNRLFASAWKAQFLSGLMQPLMVMVGNLGYVAVVVVGAHLAIAGAIHTGDILAFTQYVRNFTQPISQLAQVSNMLQMMAAAAERVFTFLEAPEETDADEAFAPERASDEHATAPSAPAATSASAVSFQHVSFGYLPGETVIKDFSFDAKPGQTVAIVGPTGAGKTTLMKLMLRFYDVTSGSVSVGGVDVRDWERAALRSNFAMVLQDTWLFAGTIRENIRYGRLDATDDEVEEAARAAHCDHFIRTLAGGYDFEINEDASNISAGQRQLLTIARAILANRRMLILDEATSSVDTRTEALIQQAMDNLMKGRTSFVIAHRLSTIRDADLILCLDNGDIVEQGTHDQLLAAGGFYANLYNSQFQE